MDTTQENTIPVVDQNLDLKQAIEAVNTELLATAEAQRWASVTEHENLLANRKLELEADAEKRAELEALATQAKAEAEARDTAIRKAMAEHEAQARTQQELDAAAHVKAQEDAQAAHEAYVAEQTRLNARVSCGVFDKDGKLIRVCDVPESLVEHLANAELGETVKRGTYTFDAHEPIPNYTAERKALYLPLEVFVDAYYHAVVNNDHAKMDAYLAHTKAVKESVPKPAM